jgi:hypothetical protein
VEFRVFAQLFLKVYYYMVNITNTLVSIIYIAKLTFIILGITLIHLKYTSSKYKFLEKSIHHFKNISEFVGLLLFSFLLMDLFNPFKKGVYISGEIQYMMFLSGIMIFITLNWRWFFDEYSKSIREVQYLI